MSGFQKKKEEEKMLQAIFSTAMAVFMVVLHFSIVRYCVTREKKKDKDEERSFVRMSLSLVVVCYIYLILFSITSYIAWFGVLSG